MRVLNIPLEDVDHHELMQAKKRLMKKLNIKKLAWRDYIMLVSERRFKW